MKIVDLKGRPLGERGPADLKPSAIIVHCVYEPDSGTVQLQRSERNPPPKNNNELKVELDNWFTVLVNCLCLLMQEIDSKMGVPRDLLVQTMIRTINTYFESGGTGGHRKKIVVEHRPDKKEKEITVTQKEAIESDYDAVFEESGYVKLGNETYIEYCGRVGLSDRDALRMPLNAEFFNSIVFRKEIEPGVFLEAARDKEFSKHDNSEVSKYLISLTHDSDALKRKTFWQITQAKNTTDLLFQIEHEAKGISAQGKNWRKAIDAATDTDFKPEVQ